jgi:hypothetical protein
MSDFFVQKILGKFPEMFFVNSTNFATFFEILSKEIISRNWGKKTLVEMNLGVLKSED